MLVAKLVWIDGDEMECCGTPFAVGQTVTWTTTKNVDRERLAIVLGAEAAAAITDREDHHDLDDDADDVTTGTVESIVAVSCRLAPQGDVLYPVEGTAVVEPRAEADGWETERGDISFLGYLVTLR